MLLKFIPIHAFNNYICVEKKVPKYENKKDPKVKGKSFPALLDNFFYIYIKNGCKIL